VIFITGFADIKVEEAYELGASAVFAKPFDCKALFSVVEKALTPIPEAWQPRAERIPADFKISLSVNAIDDRYQTKIFNFGKGGFFALLPADRLPSVGISVSFAIKVASAKESLNIEGTGIVRWVRSNNESGRPSGCGIEFMELPADSRAHVIGLSWRVINGLRTNALIPIG